MNADGLTLRFERDDDDFGLLNLSVRSGAFAGAGRGWFDVRDLHSFANALAEYPLGAAAGNGIKGEYQDAHLEVNVRQHDVRGHIEVAVVACQSGHLVQAAFRTTYAALQLFVPSVQAVLDGRSKDAVLLAEP